MTPKERIYATLKGEAVDRPAVAPIFMAWAAHYIGRTYREYYLDAAVLAESQIAVTRDFNIDQISAISDPWRETSAYGVEFEYPEEGVGKPKTRLIQSPDDVKKLGQIDVHGSPRAKDRIEGVRRLAEAMGRTHSVLGWVEGPIAEYGDLRGVENTLMDLIDKPEMFAEACEVIVASAIAFARAQIEAGADMIGVGDAAASLISPDMYVEHVLPWEKKLVDGIHEAGATVKLHICGNISNTIEHMARTGADVIDFDWMVPVEKARKAVGEGITLCGNIDPSGVLLQGTPADVAAAAEKCLAAGGKRFILMPGCEVPQGTAVENLRAFCPGPECLVEALRVN
ncbi:MAG TPA: uroporphyrinogen decarboxylase family protein [Anaerohalosphaeraceae bacterium]|jgi:MtaA/CmuA family methyltransferase|nr:uroporphyrinogen decarboxylase family protein [Anaerohalosphaeraceae bacterium]HRT51220.1 uroporphyrinogen decarboxylase family protein [Anaerohalosphaeraceae bacterium]HRT87411.1 uroporphyrinogen decarboxylase family protein [Anaerohalosphaeraceae bacterium]